MYFGRVRNEVAFSKDIPLEAKGLYSVICSLCGSKDFCYPTVKTLESYTGRSRATVQRLLKILIDQGCIDRYYDPQLNKTVIHIK